MRSQSLSGFSSESVMLLRLDAAHSVLRRTGVPHGWCEASVRDLARIVGGGTPDREQSAYWRNGTIPWITPTDLTANDATFCMRYFSGLDEREWTVVVPRIVPRSRRESTAFDLGHTRQGLNAPFSRQQPNLGSNEIAGVVFFAPSAAIRTNASVK